MSDSWVKEYDAYQARQEEKERRSTWRVIFHHDVWGNQEDGWDVNDSTVKAQEYEMPWEHDDYDVLAAFGIEDKECEDFEVDDSNAEFVEVTRKSDGRPWGYMELNVD
jgi:hypothetical protein